MKKAIHLDAYRRPTTIEAYSGYNDLNEPDSLFRLWCDNCDKGSPAPWVLTTSVRPWLKSKKGKPQKQKTEYNK